jgi:hypothetical protein
MSDGNLLNSEAIEFKKHKMELIAHLHHTCTIIKKINQDPDFKDYTLIKPKLELNRTKFAFLRSKLDKNQEKKLLILDLDETLIHVSKSTKGSAFTIPIKLRNGTIVRVSSNNYLTCLVGSSLQKEFVHIPSENGRKVHSCPIHSKC